MHVVAFLGGEHLGEDVDPFREFGGIGHPLRTPVGLERTCDIDA